MNNLRPLPTLHQILDTAIFLETTLQRAIRQVRTLKPIDTPGDPQSPIYVAAGSLTNSLMTSIAICETLQSLTKPGEQIVPG